MVLSWLILHAWDRLQDCKIIQSVCNVIIFTTYHITQQCTLACTQWLCKTRWIKAAGDDFVSSPSRRRDTPGVRGFVALVSGKLVSLIHLRTPSAHHQARQTSTRRHVQQNGGPQGAVRRIDRRSDREQNFSWNPLCSFIALQFGHRALLQISGETQKSDIFKLYLVEDVCVILVNSNLIK